MKPITRPIGIFRSVRQYDFHLLREMFLYQFLRILTRLPDSSVATKRPAKSFSYHASFCFRCSWYFVSETNLIPSTIPATPSNGEVRQIESAVRGKQRNLVPKWNIPIKKQIRDYHLRF